MWEGVGVDGRQDESRKRKQMCKKIFLDIILSIIACNASGSVPRYLPPYLDTPNYILL